jgi:hypothetical protein
MRFIGMLVCPVLLLLGALILWGGAGGLSYAATKAPRVDRPGDFFGAGLTTVIGFVVSASAVRWFWHAVRSPRSAGTRPPGE